MTTQIVITGHGHYASGIESSLNLLAGANEDLDFVDFLEEDSDTSLKEKIMKILNLHPDSQFLLVCDIVGGTPFNVCATIASSSDNMETVGGCNVMAILEAALQKDNMALPELSDFIIETTKMGVSKFHKLDADKINATNTNEEQEDGI